jgi:putative sigma-54 modulation protein
VTGEIYSAIDEVVEKLHKLVIRFKEKLLAFRKGDKRTEEAAFPLAERGGRIIKHKRFDMKPMNPDEAVEQLELLDKDFFVFANEASGAINVVYRRKDGNYGLIEPTK